MIFFHKNGFCKCSTGEEEGSFDKAAQKYSLKLKKLPLQVPIKSKNKKRVQEECSNCSSQHAECSFKNSAEKFRPAVQKTQGPKA